MFWKLKENRNVKEVVCFVARIAYSERRVNSLSAAGLVGYNSDRWSIAIPGKAILVAAAAAVVSNAGL